MVVATDGYPSGLLGRARGPDRADARAGDRDGAARRAAVRDAALRPPRFRLLASGRGRADRRRRLPRRVARPGVHRRRGAHRPGAAGALDVRQRPRRPRAARRLPLGRHLRARPGLPPRGRRGAGASGHLGRRRLLRATATCSASRAAASSRGRSSATAIRCSTSSSPPGCSAETGYSSSRGRSISTDLSERRAGDREVLDREARGVEQRDLVVAPPALCVAGQHGAELRHVVAPDDPGLDAGGQLAAVARLLPVVAEETSAAELRHRDLRLARARQRPSARRAVRAAASRPGRGRLGRG